MKIVKEIVFLLVWLVKVFDLLRIIFNNCLGVYLMVYIFGCFLEMDWNLLKDI